MSDTAFLTIGELAERFASRGLSPVEVTRHVLERIQRLDPKLHSFVTLVPQVALEQAARAEAELQRGERRSPLHGVPIAVKDLCATRGVRTTCGMKVLAEWIPDADAAVVERLRAAGAVLLGKLAMTEGAGTSHHPTVTPPVNPWNPSRWTGVSSSGSGVATAAGLCYGSLGSDTGGSIRFPSACCGIVGLKPTYGRVPLHGIFPLATSLDHVGPMTRSVGDAAAMLGVLAGHDVRDPYSSVEPVPDYGVGLDAGVVGVRIGVDEDYVTQNVDPAVATAVLATVDVLGAQGANVVPVRIPDTDEVCRAWGPILGAEVAIAHRETYPARADDYGPLRAMLEMGHRVTGIEYAEAHLARLRFAARFAALFEQVDVVLCPAAIMLPPPVELVEGGPPPGQDMFALVLRFTAPYDMTGSPSLTLPCGFSEEGLPIALQLVGRHFDEALLFRTGRAYEKATDWHTRRPPI